MALSIQGSRRFLMRGGFVAGAFVQVCYATLQVGLRRIFVLILPYNAFNNALSIPIALYIRVAPRIRLDTMSLSTWKIDFLSPSFTSRFLILRTSLNVTRHIGLAVLEIRISRSSSQELTSRSQNGQRSHVTPDTPLPKSQERQSS